MAEHDILGALEGFEIGAPGHREIIQNIRTILTTPRGSVPLDRDFGVDAALVDDPQPAVQARLTAEIVDAVERYEPRARVTQVTWEQIAESETAAGRLVPRVKVRIDGAA